MSENSRPRVLPLLLLAALLTLVVTVVRLVGELNAWDANWFDSTAGSPLCPFGIAWLVPVFGFLFGRRLARSGSGAKFVPGFFVPMFAWLALVFGLGYVATQHEGDQMRDGFTYLFVVGPILSLLALFVWPRAFVVCLAYGLLARLPVAMAQYLDVHNGWQTHYGRVYEGLGIGAADERLWFLTQAQACIWLPLTVLLGCGFAAIGAATVRRG